jgi:outer membrane protein OmpA-like peptidoglycan-associated protein
LSKKREERSSLRSSALAAAVALSYALLGGAVETAAQGTVVIGTGLPEVEVNLRALDALGPGPGIGVGAPRLLLPPGAALGNDRPLNLAPILRPPRQTAAPPPLPPQARPIAPPTPTAPPVAQPPVVAAKPAPAAPARAAATPPVAVTPKAPAPRATAPVPTAPKKPAPVAPTPKTAAIPPKAAATVATGKLLRFEFSGNSANLPDDATGKLTSLAERLLAAENMRVQVKAYAGGAEGGASAARRLSLSRALAVRGFLIDKGVRSTRIDVRALGDKPEGGPPERVDVIVVNS